MIGPEYDDGARGRCPECLAGKHPNCTEQMLDDNDEWVECACPCPGGRGL